MEGAYNIWKHEKCKRKGVYFVCDKKKASEPRRNNGCFQ